MRSGFHGGSGAPAVPGRGRGRATEAAAGGWPAGDPLARRVSRNVVLLGLTSMLTDISSEMVATILPLYLVFGLGLSPLQFGVADGAYQGVTAFVRLGGGFVADRWRRYKEVAAFGYAALGRLQAGPGRRRQRLDGADRRARPRPHGQGNPHGSARRDDLAQQRRAPTWRPRSACTARSTRPARCWDRWSPSELLRLVPRAFDAVFVVSFCFAVVGLGRAGPVRGEPAAAAGRGHEPQRRRVAPCRNRPAAEPAASRASCSCAPRSRSSR